jgi:hypothetical protein
MDITDSISVNVQMVNKMEFEGLKNPPLKWISLSGVLLFAACEFQLPLSLFLTLPLFPSSCQKEK